MTTNSIEGAGHNIRRENFASFIAALGEFLRAISDRARAKSVWVATS